MAIGIALQAETGQREGWPELLEWDRVFSTRCPGGRPGQGGVCLPAGLGQDLGLWIRNFSGSESRSVNWSASSRSFWELDFPKAITST